MKVTLRAKKKNQTQKLNEQLIEIECHTYFNKINTNVDDIKRLIHDVLHQNFIYSKEIGIICAHVAHNYHVSTDRSNNKALHVMKRLLNKYNLLFHKTQRHLLDKESIKSRLNESERQLDYDEVIDYAKYCIKLVLKDDFLQSIPNEQKFDIRLERIIKNQLKTLLLEYIPIEYSPLLLKLYLEESENEKQEEWIVKNRDEYRKLYPFHDIFQIYSSLSYHILNSKKITNSQHFLGILEQPIMGVVEWPMILGVRNIYTLPSFTR